MYTKRYYTIYIYNRLAANKLEASICLHLCLQYMKLYTFACKQTQQI